MNKILLVEDDKLFAETIKDFLEEESFVVDTASSYQQASELCDTSSFALLILDINLPDRSGVELLKNIRKKHINRPALFLTSYNDKEMLKSAFEAGGDDFVSKPADLDELLLRINALLRRGEILSQLVPLQNGYFFDTARTQLTKNQKEVDLPRKTLMLLELLAKNISKTVSFEMIEDSLYGYDEEISFGSIRVYINQLKKLLGEKSITNLRAIGYRLEKP